MRVYVNDDRFDAHVKSLSNRPCVAVASKTHLPEESIYDYEFVLQGTTSLLHAFTYTQVYSRACMLYACIIYRWQCNQMDEMGAIALCPTHTLWILTHTRSHNRHDALFIHCQHTCVIEITVVVCRWDRHGEDRYVHYDSTFVYMMSCVFCDFNTAVVCVMSVPKQWRWKTISLYSTPTPTAHWSWTFPHAHPPWTCRPSSSHTSTSVRATSTALQATNRWCVSSMMWTCRARMRMAHNNRLHCWNSWLREDICMIEARMIVKERDCWEKVSEIYYMLRRWVHLVMSSIMYSNMCMHAYSSCVYNVVDVACVYRWRSFRIRSSFHLSLLRVLHHVS